MSGPSLSKMVTLSFSATDIPSKDLLSKSDPFLLVSVRNDRNSPYTSLGVTERIENEMNPVWKNSFQLEFFFERQQFIRVDVFDADSHDFSGLSTTNFKNHDHIGFYEFTLANVMSRGSGGLKAKLTKISGAVRSKASVCIRGIENTTSNRFLTSSISITDVDHISFFSKDKYVLRFLSGGTGGHPTTCYQTPVISDNPRHPLTFLIQINLGLLCIDKFDVPFTIEVTTVDKVPKLIGKTTLTLSELVKQETSGPVVDGPSNVKVINLLRNGKPKSRAKVTFFNPQVVVNHSFLEYVQGGLDLRLIVAIDFTGSNGEPSNPSSLHYLNYVNGPGTRPTNQYLDSIRFVGEILLDYTSKTHIPVYGFGGYLSIDGRQKDTSHCYPLSRMSSQPFAAGIPHLEHLYIDSLQHTQLSGPTNFASLIQMASNSSNEPFTPSSQYYNILLILTDGVVSDLENTKKAIIEASGKPMSIVIVGVGSDDFTDMNVLDGDNRRLSSGNNVAKRDIVQFVEFLPSIRQGVDVLRKNTLEEIPGQIMEFMNMHGVKPLVMSSSPEIPFENNQQMSAQPIQSQNVDLNNVMSASTTNVEESNENNVGYGGFTY